jgi:D-alanine-D-alanine ligase
MKKERIGVLIGGWSAERDVSSAFGKNILAALIEVGYNALPIAAGEKSAQHLVDSRISEAFAGLHGRLGEDGAVQGLPAVRRASYTGSGVPEGAIFMNKVNSRQIVATVGRSASGIWFCGAKKQ